MLNGGGGCCCCLWKVKLESLLPALPAEPVDNSRDRTENVSKLLVENVA